MKATKILLLGIALILLAGTGIVSVSGIPFDVSDVDITDHTGESYFGISVANANWNTRVDWHIERGARGSNVEEEEEISF
uniref:Uncharacterized protein n=1 Tax=Candidatus Methanophagaceae archaeon ANME-1 ERB6 TaxID=2759912 RepID=A0A7G9YWJ9_9EURY|nr:hypothetical protein IAKEDICC_00003 [Methanosarcinales archaeon ANME-1 ERB6]